MAAEDSVSRIRKQDAGFTLFELMVVMMIISILMLVAVPFFKTSIKMAREAVLKEDLHVMRAAIDSYTMDKQKAPQTLDELITDGYLKAIPVDPFTNSKDTWVTDANGALYSVDQSEPGIDDVHSGSQELSTGGQAYSTW
jgi:general secretion pathway protein G